MLILEFQYQYHAVLKQIFHDIIKHLLMLCSIIGADGASLSGPTSEINSEICLLACLTPYRIIMAKNCFRLVFV